MLSKGGEHSIFFFPLFPSPLWTSLPLYPPFKCWGLWGICPLPPSLNTATWTLSTYKNTSQTYSCYFTPSLEYESYTLPIQLHLPQISLTQLAPQMNPPSFTFSSFWMSLKWISAFKERLVVPPISEGWHSFSDSFPSLLGSVHHPTPPPHPSTNHSFPCQVYLPKYFCNTFLSLRSLLPTTPLI